MVPHDDRELLIDKCPPAAQAGPGSAAEAAIRAHQLAHPASAYETLSVLGERPARSAVDDARDVFERLHGPQHPGQALDPLVAAVENSQARLLGRALAVAHTEDTRGFSDPNRLRAAADHSLCAAYAGEMRSIPAAEPFDQRRDPASLAFLSPPDQTALLRGEILDLKRQIETLTDRTAKASPTEHVAVPENVNRFDSPPGTAWKDITIEFVDEQTVKIRAKKTYGTYTYAEMGMGDRRNGRPTKQWEVLQAFRDGHGTLTWSNPKADRRNPKRKFHLDKALQRFFGFSGSAFGPTTDRSGWYARFRVCWLEDGTTVPTD